MQKIFDVDNKEDMDLLWSILNDNVTQIEKRNNNGVVVVCYDNGYDDETGILKINWHDKTEITRPVNYEDMIGCVGYFRDEYVDGCLEVLKSYNNLNEYPFETTKNTVYKYFTPAKKSELKFYGEDK
jgi:hypothetical protein